MTRVHNDKGFLVVGNWKMNGSAELLQRFHAYPGWSDLKKVAAVLCPPFTIVGAGRDQLRDKPFALGGQNCNSAESGAHTGEISAEMLAQAGASYVILGHSERRNGFGENAKQVLKKVEAAHRASLTAILCIGEQQEDRNARRHVDVVLTQLEQSLPQGADCQNTIVAYEPVWAIGSGQSATLDQIAEMHAAIADWFAAKGNQIRLLYGGSVKSDTAGDIAAVSHVNGFLVGGASLSPQSLHAIAMASENALAAPSEPTGTPRFGSGRA